MKLLYISSAFTSWLASRMPCHPIYLTWTKEHVLPKSLFPKVITSDPRNIVPMPKELNQARGNRAFTEQWENGYLKYACKDCPHPGFCRGAAVISPQGVHPPTLFKGIIARSVLHSVGKYPKFAEKINEEVLSLDTAIKWDSMYPMSKAEREWIESL